MKISSNQLGSSDLSKTILRVNPAVDRKSKRTLEIVTKLQFKDNRFAENRHKRFLATFEQRRKKQQKLFDRLKPKLDPSVRLAIDEYKEECKKQELDGTKGTKSGAWHKKARTDLSKEAGIDSRRSSLKSSILEVTHSRKGSTVSSHTDDPLASLSKQGQSRRESAFMNLLPEATPTRFVGKMHKVKRDSEKKKIESTTTEDAPSKANTSGAGFTTALRAVGHAKMGQMTRKLKKETKPDTSNLIGSILPSKGAPTPSPTSSKKPVTNAGIAAFKTKSGMFGGKKQKPKPEKENQQIVIKELKPRLFFQKRTELTDVEILANIGKYEINGELVHGLDKIVKAASIVKKVCKDKEGDKTPKKSKQPTGLPASILYVGALKDRLAAKDAQGISSKDFGKPVSRYAVTATTKFLGKMMLKKDKRGLYVGSPDSAMSESEIKDEENPVFLALEKVKLKPQISMDSGESRMGSRTSQSQSQKVNIIQVEEEDKFGEGKIVVELHDGMASVRPAAIEKWNIDKEVRGDRVRKPIMIPF